MINKCEFTNEIKRIQWLQRLLNYWTMNKVNLNIEVNQWEIYEFDFGMNVNAEISGRHYGIVLHYSAKNNPLISVIPIKTNKNKLNPYSDINLGKIEGLETHNFSVAVINQINTFDKLRIFNREVINNKTKKCLKLNDKQIKLVINALKNKMFDFV